MSYIIISSNTLGMKKDMDTRTSHGINGSSILKEMKTGTLMSPNGRRTKHQNGKRTEGQERKSRSNQYSKLSYYPKQSKLELKAL